MRPIDPVVVRILEEKELYKKQFDRCISASICPECGKELISNYKGGFFTLYGKTEYICTSCAFTHVEG
jgi:predicted RNA-binding Zn-ribbon protein involved in translation (DUF1610 family)